MASSWPFISGCDCGRKPAADDLLDRAAAWELQEDGARDASLPLLGLLSVFAALALLCLLSSGTLPPATGLFASARSFDDTSWPPGALGAGSLAFAERLRFASLARSHILRHCICCSLASRSSLSRFSRASSSRLRASSSLSCCLCRIVWSFDFSACSSVSKLTSVSDGPAQVLVSEDRRTGVRTLRASLHAIFASLATAFAARRRRPVRMTRGEASLEWLEDPALLDRKFDAAGEVSPLPRQEPRDLSSSESLESSLGSGVDGRSPP